MRCCYHRLEPEARWIDWSEWLAFPTRHPARRMITLVGVLFSLLAASPAWAQGRNNALLVGVNDLQLRLGKGAAYESLDFEALTDVQRRTLLMQSFDVYPESALGPTGLLDRSVVWRRLQPLMQRANPGNNQQTAVQQLSVGSLLRKARAARQEATTWLDTLPALDSALAEYAGNLRGRYQ